MPALQPILELSLAILPVPARADWPFMAFTAARALRLAYDHNIQLRIAQLQIYTNEIYLPQAHFGVLPVDPLIFS